MSIVETIMKQFDEVTFYLGEPGKDGIKHLYPKNIDISPDRGIVVFLSEENAYAISEDDE